MHCGLVHERPFNQQNYVERGRADWGNGRKMRDVVGRGKNDIGKGGSLWCGEAGTRTLEAPRNFSHTGAIFRVCESPGHCTLGKGVVHWYLENSRQRLREQQSSSSTQAPKNLHHSISSLRRFFFAKSSGPAKVGPVWACMLGITNDSLPLIPSLCYFESPSTV